MEGGRQGQTIIAIYGSRLESRRAAVAKGEALHARFSWARLGLFFAGIALVIALGTASAPWLAIPLVLFVPLAFAHARVLNTRDRATRAVAFYERGLARLENRWQGGGNQGERFRNPAHLYAEDLDLFGRGSMFELLATTRTSGGEATLAGWLLTPAPLPEIVPRQLALDELAPRLDLREDLSVLGPELQSAVRTEELQAWAVAAPQLTSNWPRIVAPMLAGISVFYVGQWIRTAMPPPELVVSIAVQSLFAAWFRRRVHEVIHGVEERAQELEVVAGLIDRIERDPVQSPQLQALKAQFHSTGRSPAEEIRRLARLVDIISSAHNQVFGPIAALLLLGTQLAFAVERWRARCGPAVPVWLKALAEYEALSALATYRAEHPEDCFPEIVDGPPLFDGEAVAHPLLPTEMAIANDVALGGVGHDHPHLLVVSGSNMSGKSTLLRTVGLNAVLAQAGAPVRARRLRLSPLAIGATLRLQDSLQEGRSRFYAEILRISEIVAMARLQPRVLFLFDELLAGTNSKDRLEGGTGILMGLITLGAIGLVTTHDLALTAIADRLEGTAVNVHFEDRFEDGVLTFDYDLRLGVVRSSNAIPLMRSVGLDV